VIGRQEALGIGNLLLHEGQFFHIQKCHEFLDKDFYYQFMVYIFFFFFLHDIIFVNCDKLRNNYIILGNTRRERKAERKRKTKRKKRRKRKRKEK